MRSRFPSVWIALILVGFISSAANAQEASITGTVSDSSGGVLAGVTVEASSPVLIEKVRTAVTDGNGQYRIVGLRPGAYVVTFTLSGFSVVNRGGIELMGAFTATVNAQMSVGELSETITVTGASPVVDLQSVEQKRVMSQEVVNALPTSRTPLTLAALLPGAVPGTTQDVGGTGTVNIGSASSGTIHGTVTGDFRNLLDGFTLGVASAPDVFGFQPNMGSAQEVVVSAAAGGAESLTGGMVLNIVPKEGANRFTGSFFATAANAHFQASNFTQRLKDRGMTSVTRLKRNYDINPSVGGPILLDRLWFFSSGRWYGYQNYSGDVYHNKNAGLANVWTYEPDLARPAHTLTESGDGNVRLTWQVNSKNKVNFYLDYAKTCQCLRNGNVGASRITPEAAADYTYDPTYLTSVTWSSPLSNRLLLEAGVLARQELTAYTSFRDPQDPELNLIPVNDNGLQYHGRLVVRIAVYNKNDQKIPQARASLSYVSGSHAMKVGVTSVYGLLNQEYKDNNYGLRYTFNQGVPVSLTQVAAPFDLIHKNAEVSLFAQDRWTIDRLTLNVGIRYDGYHMTFPEHHYGPTIHTPNRNFTIPAGEYFDYKDLSPRLGVAYDLFGTRKTALKASLNRYPVSLGYYEGSPSQVITHTVNRSWNDRFYPQGDPRRGNFIPDCDLTQTATNGECGSIPANFGRQISTLTTVDPESITGWNNRSYNYEFSTGVQHEIFEAMSLDFNYFRRWYGNFRVTHNRALSPSDFTAYSVTTPVDPRLPGGGGQVISGLLDLNPSKTVGGIPNDPYTTLADNYGKQTMHWNGIDLTINARPRGGLMFAGGVSTGRTTTDNCEVLAKVVPVATALGGGSTATGAGVGPTTNNPSLLYCHVEEALRTQFKGFGSYALPWMGLQLAATFQSMPGRQISALIPYTSAQVAGSLGRPLSTATQVNVSAVAPGTMFSERVNQLDVRIGKVLRFGRARSAVNFDLYNALNTDVILSQNNSYIGWQQPLEIIQGRLAKFSVQFDF